jgi:phage gpG-like protein
MSNDAIQSFNLSGLEQMLKALKVKKAYVKVGILGSTNSRKNNEKSGAPSSNAEIGAAHEFGTSRIPQRSFLRMPLNEKLDKEIEKSGLNEPRVIGEVIKGATLKPYLDQVAIAAKAVILDAFDTGGFGKWPAWKNPNYENNTGSILVDTKQLRDSIATEVVDG